MDNIKESDYSAYLSKEFFEQSLKAGLKVPSVTVTDFKLSMGSLPGDNYCSVIYRALVTYNISETVKGEVISLIIKAITYTEERGPMLEILKAFTKEIHLYTNILPKLTDILNIEMLGAKFYYATSEPVKLIVFQDLKTLGYRMVERQTGLDENHCKIVLAKLAKLHAASVELAKKEPKSMDMYSFGMFPEEIVNNWSTHELLSGGLTALIQIVSTWPGYEPIVDKIKKIEVDIVKKMIKYCTTTSSSIRVFNHGDFWINNFMFKYDDNNQPISAVFMDYQMSFYSSPGIDLNYFMGTSPVNEIREKKRDELIDFYIHSFINTLTALNHKTCPTIDEMRKEIASREFYGFYAAFMILPIVLLNKETSADSSIETLVNKETALTLRKLMYTQPNYQIAIKGEIDRLEKLQIFDQDYE